MSRKRNESPWGGMLDRLKGVCEWFFQNKRGNRHAAGDPEPEQDRSAASGKSRSSVRIIGEQKRYEKDQKSKVRIIHSPDEKTREEKEGARSPQEAGTNIRSLFGEKPASQGAGTNIRSISGSKEAQDKAGKKKAAPKPDQESTRSFPESGSSGKQKPAANERKDDNAGADFSDEEAFAGLNYVDLKELLCQREN